MSEQKPSPPEMEIDYGKALRLVRTVRRCLPEINMHWVEPGQPHCQCGKTARLRQPSNSTLQLIRNVDSSTAQAGRGYTGRLKKQFIGHRAGMSEAG